MSATPVLDALGTLPVDLLAALSPPPADLPHTERRDIIRQQLETMATALAEPGPAVGSVEDVRLGELPVRIYRPAGTAVGVLVFLHGGGWWQGWMDAAMTDTACRERCAGTSAVVVSLDYRKAPEHPFPAGLDDVLQVLSWLIDNADTLEVAAERIVLTGQSAGANLAAAAALRRHHAPGPRLAGLLLEVPALDLTPEADWIADAAPAEVTALRECMDFYLGTGPQATDPHRGDVSPVHADDLSAMPRTHLMTAGLDPLRHDGHLFHRRLLDAGVEATLTEHPHHLHGTPLLTALLPEAREWRTEVIARARLLLDVDATLA